MGLKNSVKIKDFQPSIIFFAAWMIDPSDTSQSA